MSEHYAARAEGIIASPSKEHTYIVRMEGDHVVIGCAHDTGAGMTAERLLIPKDDVPRLIRMLQAHVRERPSIEELHQRYNEGRT